MNRVSPGAMTALVFAILVGLGGAYTIRKMMEPPTPIVEPEFAEEPEMVVVPTAAYDLEKGYQISLYDLVPIKMTREQFEKSPYRGMSFVNSTRDISGRVLREPIKKGDVFSVTSFFPVGSGPGIANNLRPGYRAMSISVTNIAAVAGFVRPGSFVDVLFRSSGRQAVTMSLLEGVEVLAVGASALPASPGDASAPGTVTLACSPRQSKALQAVQGAGDLTLTLRNPDEVNRVPVLEEIGYERITLDQIIGIPPQPVPQTMDVWLGGARTTVVFPGAQQYSKEYTGAIETPILADDQH